MAIVFTYLNARWLYTLSDGYRPGWLTDPRFLLGVALFWVGFIINYRADRTLAKLRKPGGTGYQLPRGGLYAFISCPSYFGEIIERAGFALAAWSIPGLSFAIWSAANSAPRAITHHNGYREKFAD